MSLSGLDRPRAGMGTPARLRGGDVVAMGERPGFSREIPQYCIMWRFPPMLGTAPRTRKP